MAAKSKTQGRDPELQHEEGVAMAIDATRAVNTETHMSLLKAIKVYPKAVGWSVLLSTAVVMEGFDLSLINSFFAYTSFRQQYGEIQPDGTYQITAAW